MKNRLPFNKWSIKKIREKRKICTSRNTVYSDKRVYLIMKKKVLILQRNLKKFGKVCIEENLTNGN